MKRDVISFASYKTNLALLLMNALFGALSYLFLGSNAVVQSVVNYKTFLLIGVAFNTYLAQSLTLVQKTINPWSLEEVLVSPTRLSTFIIGSSLWGFIWSTGVIFIYLGLGVLAFGVVLQVDILGTALVVALGVGVFIGFSMIGAGILIVTKQGDPVTALVSILTSVFGNVLFPIQVMPPTFQLIAKLEPIYYFFQCIRPVLTGGTLLGLGFNLMILAVWFAIMLPGGYLIYSWCLKTARKNGTLSWF